MTPVDELIEQEAGKLSRKFAAVSDDHYRWELPDIGTVLTVDRLHREKHELHGELCVRCNLPGARTVTDGVLSTANFNLSSDRSRTDRAKQLALRAKIDFGPVIEEFCQRVLEAERIGQPAVDLRTMAASAAGDELRAEGFYLPRRHPSILFGDGGTLKSYIMLFLAGRMVESGMRVGIFDWELAGEDHRERLERLFPEGMPRIVYARCERPLIHEVDRLRRIVHDDGLEYVFYDSVAFACDGPPESAESAGKYFRAVRQIGGGSLHVAHVSKGENADQKPFGSAFWHNGARSTWYAKLAEASPDNEVLHLGLFNRKSNLGKIRAPIGFRVQFEEQHTTFRREDVADTPDLARQMTVRQRMQALLRRGAMTPEAIAEEIEAEVETVKRTARRYKDMFIVNADGRLGLLEKRAS